MNIRLKKALTEIRLNPGRSVLVVLALCLGLWGVGANVVSYTILKNDLNENFIRTQPYHAAFTSTDFDKLDLAAFRQRDEIESAEFRDLVYLRVEAMPDYWLPLWLFGVDDFDQFQLARIYHQSGDKTPPPGTIAIERNGRLVSDLTTGSSARVRIGTQIKSVPISSIVFDPAQAPATQDAFIYAYTDKQTFRQISGEASDQRLIVRFNNAHNKEQVQQLGKQLLDYFQSQGITITSYKTLTPNQHPHQFQLNTLIAFQGSIGFLALIMGAVFVSQLMESILSKQVRQIGVMKAIGAKRSQVLNIYIVTVLVFGVIATLLTLPIAIATGYGFAKFLSITLNFDILTTSLPHQIYVLLISFGLLLPVLLSLPTLFKGTRISVKDALNDYGITDQRQRPKRESTLTNPGNFRLLLAVRNSLRRKKRLLITVSMIALGVAIFSAGFNVRQSLVNFLDESKQSMKYDVQVALKKTILPETALAPFKELSNLDRVETWSGGQGRLQSGVIATSNGIGIVALPYDSNLMQWNVIEGRWLNPKDDIEVVLNQLAADEYPSAKVGGDFSIRIEGMDLNAKLVGIVKEFNPPKIYIDKTQYDNAVNPEHRINSLMFVASDRNHQKVIQLKKDIERAIAGSDLDVLFVTSQTERAQIIYNHLDIILSLFTFLSLVVLMVSALGMASAMGINILERTREIGVMRAIGATPAMVYQLFRIEGYVVNTISIIAGLLLSLPLSAIAAKFFGKMILGHNTSLNFAFSHFGFVVTLIVTFVFAWLASKLTVRNALRVSTRDALSYE